MKLKIFGSGCTKCNLLTQHAEAAAQELGIDYELEKVKDINQIIDAGVMRTPALAVDDVVVVAGSVPSTEKIKQLLS
ncbi:MAG: thioredoxin family protein [Xanthomonadales bacterium]|nr:thioredoxin family protein [Xanthomonadales bacterium]